MSEESLLLVSLKGEVGERGATGGTDYPQGGFRKN